MSGEHARPSRGRRRRAWRPPLRLGASRLPVRSTDSVEDLTAWLLVSLGLLAALGAVLLGRAAHDAALSPGRLGGPTPVRAVLLADVPRAPSSAQPTASPLPRVPVEWTAVDGTEETGELVLRAPMPAGAAVDAWVDREGRLTATPPPRTAEAIAFGVGAGLAAGALAWGLLVLAWSGVCRLTAARNDAAWAREWERVEPMWSRRVC
jgi:hypothetical protein